MKLVNCENLDNANLEKADEPELIMSGGERVQGYYAGNRRYERIVTPSGKVRWMKLAN